jgi:hypothetical protein
MTLSDLPLCHNAIPVLALGVLACGGVVVQEGPREGAAVGEGTVSARAEPGELAVLGAVLVRPGHPDTAVDLVLGRDDSGYLVVRDPAADAAAAVDTIDAAGLYIHSAKPFVPLLGVRAGEGAWFTVRTGRSAGSPAVWRILPDRWGPVEPAENRPPGPLDPAVGCYMVELGEWADPDLLVSYGFNRIWVPHDLRLHWQYGLREGREEELVMTDLRGDVLGRHTVGHTWRSLPGDSLGIWVWNDLGHHFLRILVGQNGDDRQGHARVYTHSSGGPETEASVRLRRVACPQE